MRLSLCILLLCLAPALGQEDPNALLDLPIIPPLLDVKLTPPKQNLRQAVPIPPPAPPPQPQPTDEPKDEPPPTIYGEEIDSESDTLYYVLDISGSMDSDPQPYLGLDGQSKIMNRMERAKIELIRSIMGLPQNFKFNVIAFDCNTFMWSGSLVPANDLNKQVAIGWVQMLTPRDSTGTGPAVSLALNDKQNQTVLLITDGAPNCGVPAFATFALTGRYDEYTAQHQHRVMIQSRNTQGAHVNVFGIAASGSYRAFCQGVATDNNGYYKDVP